MVAQPKSVIKSYFQSGDRPTQAQFEDLIDSYLNTGGVGTSDYGAIVAVSGNPSVATGPAGYVLTSTGSAATPTFQAASAGITSLTGAVTASGSGAVATSLGSFTSAELKTALTNETGGGSAVFADQPTLNQPTLNQPNIVGTITNDNAAAGSVGELIESTVLVGSAVSLTTATSKTITSISLTAGDWDVWGNIIFSQASGTTCSNIKAGISSTNNTLPVAPGGGAFNTLSLTFATGATEQGFFAGFRRVSVASTTTYYLIGEASFGTSTMSAYGYLGARRVR